VGFVVDKVAVGQVSFEYFGFTCQSSFHRLLHNHPHLSSGAGTIGQLVADVTSGLSLTPPQETYLEIRGDQAPRGVYPCFDKTGHILPFNVPTNDWAAMKIELERICKQEAVT
jgi:hypothetical protein